MANVALQITCPVSASTPFGRIPFLQHTPSDVSKKQPLIIYLHGAGNRSLVQDTTTVLGVQSSSEGLPWLTNSANTGTNGLLPSFDDVEGETFRYYILAPQLYGKPGASTELWNNQYITRMMDYAVANLNVDTTRFYLCGYSLGAGGTVIAIGTSSINRRLAAAAGVSPGYGQSGNFTYIAKSGIPFHLIHAANDTTASIGVSDTIIKGIRLKRPLMDPKYNRLQTGGHGIQFTMFDLTEGDVRNQTNGTGSGQTIIDEPWTHYPSMFNFFLRHRKLNAFDPYYP